MKKVILLLLPISFLVISCGGDDTLEGTYSLNRFGSDDCLDLPIELNFEDDSCDDLFGFQVCASGTFLISEDGTFVTSLSIESIDSDEIELFDLSGMGSWTSTGSTITLCDVDITDSDECVSGQINGDLITFTIDEDDCNTFIELRRS